MTLSQTSPSKQTQKSDGTLGQQPSAIFRSPAPWLVIAALILIQVLFGVNYVVSKVVVKEFPPLVWASARIAISTLIMASVALISKRPHPPWSREFFVPMIGFALLGTVINQASFLVGLHYTTSSNSAVLNTLIPVFTLLLVTVRGQEAFTPQRLLGFIFAFSGVLVIRKVEDISFNNTTWIGDLLTILNCFSYAMFLSFSKKFLQKYDPIWATTWLFFYGTIGLTLLALPDWLHFQMPVMTTQLTWSAVYAVVGATLLTYFLSFWALRYAKSSQVALFIYLQPIIATVIAWSWFGEAITTRTLISSALIFCGLLFALSDSVRQKAHAAHLELAAMGSKS
ncbi:MAG: DMT family transporter [Methylotenera sp.]|nr:DMT family transporter [Oligoflexia bacterium]